jgi:hypothetical protein
MPLILHCPQCKTDFTLPHKQVNTIEDTYYDTIDCGNKECNALLYSHEEKGIILFHEYMNEETNGLWGKDGKNTGYIEIPAGG